MRFSHAAVARALPSSGQKRLNPRPDENRAKAHQVETLPRLKLKVEYALIGFLLGELNDEEFKARIQAILDEFEGKALLHRNISQLTGEWEKRNRALSSKFETIWLLLGQVSPQIRRSEGGYVQ